MSEAVLKLEHVGRQFTQGGVTLHVLRDANMEIKRGEVVAVVGPSGCGKTTLLQVAGLLDVPQSGTVTIGGTVYNPASDRKRTAARRSHLGFVYQFHHLLPEFTAVENAMMPCFLAGMPKKEAAARAAGILEQLGLLERLNHRPGELSGGEQQRVAIARALCSHPLVVLADEPTGNLDPATADVVFGLMLKQVRELNMALVLVTHDQALAKRADRALTLKEGVVVPA